MSAIGQQERQISDLLQSKILKVIVGKDEAEKVFSVHQDLICSCSDFFKNAMNGEWKESDTGTIHLTDDDPKVFAKYLQACYTGNFNMGRYRYIYADDAIPLVTEDEAITLAAVYALAEKLMDGKAKKSRHSSSLRCAPSLLDPRRWCRRGCRHHLRFHGRILRNSTAAR
ncbi:hypothetical protein CC80DRAFT_496902 [Byssothecium circinans]|uniref:BTB domain-containing protein n=1 Tax=Byssothecium circinans TaxID=147558 RepID=A0A6A5THI8_9PLEO|nr:hypothetical protein CC80DRAFT_496902 [Byssothecium circinans]